MKEDTRKEYQKPEAEIIRFSEEEVNCLTTSVPISSEVISDSSQLDPSDIG